MTPFKPDHLPIDLDWSSIVTVLSTANRYVARYDGLLQSILNPDVLLSPLRTQEAVLSSKIEGTQATLEEVLGFEADKKTPEARKEEIHEVINYRLALIEGRYEMFERPLSLNLIRRLHSTLMHGVRGQTRDPGNFRRIQNWIGSPGSKQNDARFVPPDVPTMHEALNNWEHYLHYEEKDPLVQLAIIHAQFEIIHPFLDGNGRIGRILIPLFLYHKKIIQQPVFYISEYLERNRKEYYDSLKEITDSRDWTNWIKFFLNGIVLQAEKNTRQTKAIIDLYELMKHRIVEETHSQFAIQCLDFIFSNPIFNSSEFYKDGDINRATASRLIKAMERSNIITCLEKGMGNRPSVYQFQEIIDIINI